MIDTVALHIGAHKTATTHLQQGLRAASRRLRRHGVAYYGPHILREPGQTLAEQFGILGEPAIAMSGAERAEELAAGASRLILSDENFIGFFAGPRGRLRRPIYPLAAERIAVLAEALDPLPLEVFLSLRAPAGYLESTYSQLLLAGHALAPFDYFTQNRIGMIDWADLVARVSAVPGCARVTVWAYEDYPQIAPALCVPLLGENAAKVMRLDPMPSHAGLSEAAVADVMERLGAGETGALAKAARRKFPISDDTPRYSPFVEDDLARSETRYRTQLARIAQMEKVQLLTLPAQAGPVLGDAKG